MTTIIAPVEQNLLNQLKAAAAAGLSDSSFEAVLKKFDDGYYLNKAISVNTGKAVTLSDRNTYIYFTRGPYNLAIRKNSIGNASYFVLSLFFNWYCDSLKIGKRIEDVKKEPSAGEFLHMQFKKKWDIENVIIVPSKESKRQYKEKHLSHCEEINSDNDSLDGFIVSDGDTSDNSEQVAPSKKRQRIIDLTDD